MPEDHIRSIAGNPAPCAHRIDRRRTAAAGRTPAGSGDGGRQCRAAARPCTRPSGVGSPGVRPGGIGCADSRRGSRRRLVGCQRLGTMRRAANRRTAGRGAVCRLHSLGNGRHSPVYDPPGQRRQHHGQNRIPFPPANGDRSAQGRESPRRCRRCKRRYKRSAATLARPAG